MSIEYRDVQISAVIFDMDRLLVETSAVWEQPAQKLMSELGLRWSSEISKHYRGMDAKDVVITIHNLFNPKKSLAKCHAIYRQALLGAFATTHIVPMHGANEMLAFLHGKVPMVIASGSPAEGINEVLNRFGWHDYFEVVLSSEDVGTGRGKPFPDVFIAAAETLEVPPKECLVFEDSLAGVKAALVAGMNCIAVPTANPRSMLDMDVEIFDSLCDAMNELQRCKYPKLINQ